MFRMMICLALAGIPAKASAQASQECLASAHRLQAFIEEEAVGTRHEKQIQDTYEAKGGKGKAIAELATKLNPDECGVLLMAPDSMMRAMAIATLPERNGQ